MNDGYLKKEDYAESCCSVDFNAKITKIPTDRVIDTLDGYLNRKDYAGAERHLNYWLNEALAGNDIRGRLTVLNEQIGLFRKTGKEDEGIKAVKDALELISSEDIDGTVTSGTTLLNCATAYKAFRQPEKALELYKKARLIYESNLSENDGRLGGLYNNTALALTELGLYEEAEELYYRALEVMKKQKNGEAEEAITYLNLADLSACKSGLVDGDEKITLCLNEAERLLNTDTLPRNGYYAFVCEKCAPTFGYYGYFLTEKELNKRAEEIYEGN